MQSVREARERRRYVAHALRPGVQMPDWSLVSSQLAPQALDATFAVADRYWKWARLGDQEDRVWRGILEGFAATGRPPGTAAIADTTRLSPGAVSTALDQLRTRDLIVRAADTDALTAAYPFCAWPSGHRVRWDGAAANALCAIDALGMGAMLGRDTTIEAGCRRCGAPIQVETRRRGMELATASPATSVVWCGIAYAGNCGATSGCTLKVFFCSDEHLHAWRDDGCSAGEGFRLSLDEAHQVGRAMFAPMLRQPVLRPGRIA